MSICGLYFLTLVSLCGGWMSTCSAAAGERLTKNYHAVVIQGAGYLPDAKKPEGVDAITQATTKGLNTYSLTTALAEKLVARDIEVTVLPFSACAGLTCLSASPEGTRKRADLVIFAGPSYFSKQPEQLLALYPKLKEAVAYNPRLICSALVPAWYPESKGKATLEHALKTASEAGARSVPGVTLLTPRGDKKGASAEEVDKALTDFATRLAEALKSGK